MIEIKGDGKSTSITGEGSIMDVFAVYAGIAKTVAANIHKATGSKAMTNGFMIMAWLMAREDAFGEEGDDT